MEMETAQIKGVDSAVRVTKAKLADRATLIIHEKIMTHGTQSATTDFTVDLDGVDCGTHVVSRSVAKEHSKQCFLSCVNGNNKCNGHTECDAIIMDAASVSAITSARSIAVSFFMLFITIPPVLLFSPIVSCCLNVHISARLT